MRDNNAQFVVRPKFSRPKGDENGSTPVVRPKFSRPKGDENGSTPVVRLAPRPVQKIVATTLPHRVVSAPVVHLSSASKSKYSATPISHVRVVANSLVHAEKSTTSRVASKTHSKKFILSMFAKQTHHTMSVSLGLTFASGMIGKFATVLLIPMLLLQPLLPVYAADESVTAPESAPAVIETPAPESSPLDTATPVEAPASSEEPVTTDVSDVAPAGVSDGAVSEVTNEEVPLTPPEETPATEEATGDTATTETISEETTPLPSTGGTTGDTENASGTDTGTSTPPESLIGGESSEAVIDPSMIANDATTTESEVVAEEEEVVVPTEEVPVVDEAAVRAAAEESARLAEEARQEQIRQTIKKEVVSEFTKGCLTLDGVGYYCLKNFDGSAVGALTPSTAVTGVSSQKDPSGNYKQIFIMRGEESIQLTHDAWDNTFPSMDVSGKSVVWQGMAEGRWQIFIADVSSTGTPAITQLTHGTESNFNPRVDSDTIVWQGWVNGNWEIFLADRLLPAAYYPLRPDTPQDPGGGLPLENRMLGIDNTWHVSRLTTNDTHDMFPAIAAGLVTWQSSQGGSWNVYAYSMKSGVTTKLSQDGTKSENPRFAVTWDEHDANGNARMVGYDIASGKTIDISNEARNTPSGSAPYRPTETPISQPNQAALPPTSTGTSTTMKVDGDDTGGTNTLGT